MRDILYVSSELSVNFIVIEFNQSLIHSSLRITATTARFIVNS